MQFLTTIYFSFQNRNLPIVGDLAKTCRGVGIVEEKVRLKTATVARDMQPRLATDPRLQVRLVIDEGELFPRDGRNQLLESLSIENLA